MNNQKIEIDLVYLWVDGSDPEWQKKKQKFTNVLSDNSETNAAGRYTNNDELRYSLRSVEKHAPWIRNIFIVTDNQKPEWLNTDHPKVRLVDHSEIVPHEVLPLFNAIAIEYFLYRIPGLSEYFLYANDDMFFNADLLPDFFFAPDGNPIVCLKKKKFGKWYHRLRALIKDDGHYRRTVINSMNLVEKKCGKFYSGLPHHNIDSYRKSDYLKAVEEVFSDQVKVSQHHRTRTEGGFHRSAIGYYSLAVGHGHIKYVSRKTAARMQIYMLNFKEQLDRNKPLLFCLNDNEHATDEHRKQVQPFLESVFPNKSAFEK
jgi:hypothetical protein